MPKTASERPRRHVWVFDPYAPTAKQRRNEGFSELIRSIQDMFELLLVDSEPVDFASHTDKGSQVQLIGLHSRETERFVKSANMSVACQLVAKGYLPSSPSHIKSAFSVELLVLWDRLRRRSRGVDVGIFLKRIYAAHGVKYTASMRNAFESAFDNVYKALRRKCGSDDVDEFLLDKYPNPPYHVLNDIFENSIPFFKVYDY